MIDTSDPYVERAIRLQQGNKDTAPFLKYAAQSAFFVPQNAVYLMLPLFLVHSIFAFYVEGEQKCKCPPLSFKGFGLMNSY
jgi:hypothetical protein